MSSTHRMLKIRCAELRIPMEEMCRRANVPYATVAAWAASEPKTLVTLQKLTDALEAIAAERSGK